MLILRDVLGFSASETAEILDTTVVSVNSSLQRARARLKETGVRQELAGEPSAAEQRAWVERYMKAFELADVETLKRLITEDVLMEMPPMLNWFTGRGRRLVDQASAERQRKGRRPDTPSPQEDVAVPVRVEGRGRPVVPLWAQRRNGVLGGMNSGVRARRWGGRRAGRCAARARPRS
ncbi:hypothetical protein OHR68_16390 [Spirillospora sp. NBC_00431]